MNTSFLRELAENINLSFRSHADTDKETLVNLLNKKANKKSLKVSFPFPSDFNGRVLPVKIIGGELKLLSRDCDGCSQMKACSRRYYVVEKGDKVYCPDGTVHLVDGL